MITRLITQVKPVQPSLLHFFKNSSALTHIIINGLIVIFWGISLLLYRLGVPYFTPIFGTLALFAPGLCLAILTEQLTESRTRFLFFSLWVILFTFVLTPAAVYSIGMIFLKQSAATVIIQPFLIWWALCFTLTVVVIAMKRQPISISHISINSRTKKELLWIFGGFSALMLINFTVYPLLPEGDGYAYLIRWQAIQIDPLRLSAETRIPFYVFINLWTALLKLDSYWLFKVFLPLSHVTMVLACYILGVKFLADSRYRVIAAFSPFLFPIILQESLISRPQSIFLISFLPSMILLADLLSRKDQVRAIYWLFSLLTIGIIGIITHTLFAIIAFIALISIVLFLRNRIAKYPLDSTAIILGLAVLILPTILKSRIIPDTARLLELFGTALQHGRFEWWFIDHYRNIDGAEVGWPGLSSLFYYAYNLGLAFPILFIWFFIWKKAGTLRTFLKDQYWAVIFLFICFFFISEIGPRFQIAYLPDRAWLVLSLVFAFTLPFILSEVVKNRLSRLIKPIGFICFASLLAGTSLTYAKQGWVTSNEVAAAPFIRDHTPPNSLFLTQGGTRMMIRYYTKRTANHGPAELFLTGEKAALETYLQAQAIAHQATTEASKKQQRDLAITFNHISNQLSEDTVTAESLELIFNRLNTIAQNKPTYFIESADEAVSTANRPIYIIYNEKKFNSLYGRRSWWRISNFYGAKVDRLSQNFPIVYNKDGVTIWEAKK